MSFISQSPKEGMCFEIHRGDVLNNLTYHYSERLMLEGHLDRREVIFILKFEMAVIEPENTVITSTAQATINLSGQIIKIGAHCVILSGVAILGGIDWYTVRQLAKENGDLVNTRFDCEIICGPSWQQIDQCSFIISPGKYSNTNSDEDDMQSFQVSNLSWDAVQQGTSKRIRLKFRLTQLGENSLFDGVSYQVTSTGNLDQITSVMPPACDKPRIIGDVGSSGDLDLAYIKTNVKDGNLNTMWRSTNIFEPWLRLYLDGDGSHVCRVDIAWADGNTRQYQFDVYVTDDNHITTVVLQDVLNTGTTTNFESYPFDPTKGRALVIRIKHPSATSIIAQISEVKVFGNF
jgi:hypothetical protein